MREGTAKTPPTTSARASSPGLRAITVIGLLALALSLALLLVVQLHGIPLLMFLRGQVEYLLSAVSYDLAAQLRRFWVPIVGVVLLVMLVVIPRRIVRGPRLPRPGSTPPPGGGRRVTTDPVALQFNSDGHVVGGDRTPDGRSVRVTETQLRGMAESAEIPWSQQYTTSGGARVLIALFSAVTEPRLLGSPMPAPGDDPAHPAGHGPDSPRTAEREPEQVPTGGPATHPDPLGPSPGGASSDRPSSEDPSSDSLLSGSEGTADRGEDSWRAGAGLGSVYSSTTLYEPTAGTEARDRQDGSDGEVGTEQT